MTPPSDRRPDGLDPNLVYGSKDLSIAILRGTLEEVSLPPNVGGWISLGRRIEPDGDGRYLAVHVQRKVKMAAFEYLLAHLELAESLCRSEKLRQPDS